MSVHDGPEYAVISVGVSFLRFLEVAEKLRKMVAVVTDNDGDVEALERKYANYLGANSKEVISICYDSVVDEGELKIGDKKFNYNTLEPKLVRANGFAGMNALLDVGYAGIDDLHKHMKSNKTNCALKLFDSDGDIYFPDYILRSIADE